MKIAVVENERVQAELLESYIKKYFTEKKISCIVDIFFNGVDFLSDYTADYDAVFMDVQMPFLDGIGTAEKLRTVDEAIQIVFVTNMAQYAIRGYKVRALDYLLKPVGYFDLSLELDKICRLSRSLTENFLWVTYEGKMRRVPFGEILFIEIMNHNVCIHLEEETIVYRGTLKDVEGKLDKELFSRSDNCYIVNMSCVSKIDGDIIVLQSKDRLHISRSRKKQFMTDLTNYINRGNA